MSTKTSFFETDRWVPCPMIDDEHAAQGYIGGEACQQVLCPVLDPIEGKYGLFGTDVAGVYRSEDGGRSWVISTVGYDAAGGCGAAFDPNNIERCLIVGANSGAQDVNGLFLSTDHGTTWTPVLRARTYGYRDFRTQIAYDESSYDEKIGGSAIIYWSREDVDYCRYAMNDPSLYKSTDGGVTWTQLPNTALYANSYLAVHKEKGWLLSANTKGIFRSKDGAATFEKVLDKEIFSMDTVRTHPNMVWATACEGVFISEDYGDTWTCLKGENYPDFHPDRIRVSPVNINHMVLEDDYTTMEGNRYGHIHAFSRDGGKTWGESIRQTVKNNPLWVPSNSARSAYCWDPKDENRVICNWNYICASDDAGENFWYSNTGFNGIATGHIVKVNVNDPQLILLPSQDYNGGFSVNGGKTYKYVNWAGHEWGGHTYGGYCMSDKISFVSRSESWSGGRFLTVTHDGGETIDRTEIAVKGITVGMGVPGKPEVGFMGEWRTDDWAETWTEMKGCLGVYACDYETGTVFGYDAEPVDEKTKRHFVVVSRDAGITWERLVEVTALVTDIAYNRDQGSVYYCAGDQFWHTELNDPEPKQRLVGGFIYNKMVKNVAVDPKYPNLMYVSCMSNKTYGRHNIWRTLDGGKSWLCLNRKKGDGRTDPDGGRRPTCLVVGGNERNLFVFAGCKGVWKMACPPEEACK